MTSNHLPPASTSKVCKATRADGSPCRAGATPDGYCFAHSPALRERTAEARRQGGRNRSNARRSTKYLPADLRELAGTMLEAIDEVHDGKLDPKRLTAMASGASAVVRLFEVGEIEQRLAALERQEGIA